MKSVNKLKRMRNKKVELRLKKKNLKPVLDCLNSPHEQMRIQAASHPKAGFSGVSLSQKLPFLSNCNRSFLQKMASYSPASLPSSRPTPMKSQLSSAARMSRSCPTSTSCVPNTSGASKFIWSHITLQRVAHTLPFFSSPLLRLRML